MLIKHTGFQSLLYYVFIFEKKHRVDETADKMGISPQTLYDYIEGRRYFPPDLISRLYNATKDYRFLEFFLKPCGLVAVEKAKAEPAVRDVLLQIVACAKEHGDVMAEVKKALEDGVITKQELKVLEKEIDEDIRAKEQLRMLLKEMSR